MFCIYSLTWYWRCKEPPFPLSPDLGLWRTKEVPNLDLGFRYRFGYCHWSLMHPCFEFRLFIFILKVQGTSMSSEVLTWGFGGCWRFLTWAWHHILDLNMVTDLWYAHVLNIGSLSWFWRYKEHPRPTKVRRYSKIHAMTTAVNSFRTGTKGPSISPLERPQASDGYSSSFDFLRQ